MRQLYVYKQATRVEQNADRAQGHIITIEITSGEVYRGKLIEGAPPQAQSHERSR